MRKQSLTDSQKSDLDKVFSLEEIHQAMLSMKLNKVGGCDGWSLEFYITFWEDLKDFLWQMYVQELADGILGRSARQGIISLLAKKSNPREIKNLHPLTLLNIEYKILAKAMALRLKTVLPSIISDTQTGFMEGRQISWNLRKTIDIVSHIYNSGKQAVIISLDFEKCFDRIEHESIFKSLAYFNFGNNLVKWSRVFFNKFEVCTHNAGHTA